MVIIAGLGRSKKSLSGGYRSRVELALRLGVAPRRLEGWEPAEVVEYEHDSQGRVLRAVIRRESEYDDQQVHYLLAYLEAEKDRGTHGIPMSEATDFQNSFEIRRKRDDLPRGHYKAYGPVIDYAEQALQSAKKIYYSDKSEDYDRSADVWTVDWVPDK